MFNLLPLAEVEFAAVNDLSLSAIIVSFNSAHRLEACVGSISSQLPNAEILVVDNASSDDSADVARRLGAAVLRLPHNAGFGRAVNAGVAAASSSLCLILNPDAVIASVDLAALRCLTSKPALGIVGCEHITETTDDIPLQPALALPAEIAWSLASWFLLPRWPPVSKTRVAVRPNLYVSGSGFLVDRQELTEVGSFDPALFLYYEDYDVSRRYAKQNLQVTSTAAIRIRHQQGTSSPRVEETMMACAFCSLVELAARDHGSRYARMSLSAILLALRIITWVGMIVSSIPGTGSTPTRKANQARQVFNAIVDIDAHVPSEAYPRTIALINKANPHLATR